ncbi:hypothetical protein SAMN05421741_11336 [Paenimyroides ummariense]|uniref:Uncharacterized protein n=2 Tax=Paenimyroides ummariense TaxID=913024 RepID=A0A1I5CRZ1_9FLAO|nr:hypothetical protein SAMN05421741_11336 [Paenimyroides ummariense]
MYACSNDNETTAANSSVEQKASAAKGYKFVNMKLPVKMRSYDSEFDLIVENVIYKGADNKETEGQIRFKIPHNDFKIVSMEFSENLLEAGKINPDFFIENSESLLKAYGDPEDDKDKPADPCCPPTHGQRIKECYEMKKGEGRGWCVAGEFISTIGHAFKGLFKR